MHQYMNGNAPTAPDNAVYRRLTAAALLFIVIGCIAGVMVPAGLQWDFANFYDAGRIVDAGQQASLLQKDKSTIAGITPLGNLDFWGTPLSAWLYVPLGRLQPETALILFKIENVLAYGAALLVLFFHLREFVPRDNAVYWRMAAIFSIAALLYQPFWTVFRVGGQTTATVLLLLTVALVTHYRLRFAWSSLLFVLAVMIKPALATGLLFLMIVSGVRFALFTVAYIVALGLFSIALMGLDVQVAFVDKMLSGSSFTGDWFYSSALFSIILQYMYAFDWPKSLMLQLSAVVKLGVVASFAWVVFRTRPRLAERHALAHFNFLLAIMFFLLVSQTLWEHYLSLMFIPLVFLLVPRTQKNTSLTWMGLVFAASLPLQNIIIIQLLQYLFALDSITLLTPLMLLKTAPLWLGWIFVLRHHEWFISIYQQDIHASTRLAVGS